MNKLVVVLAASTAVSASAAWYWRSELIEERARNQRLGDLAPAAVPPPAAAVLPASATPGMAVESAKPSAPPPKTNTPAVAVDARPPEALPGAYPPPPLDEARKQAMRERAAQFLGKYNDPVQRAVLREQALANARRSLKGFDKEADLDAVTFEELVQLTADQETERRAFQARCMADPQCEATAQSQYREFMERSQAELASLIGEDKARDLQAWAASAVERRMIATLTSRLPASVKLSSAQSTALIGALAAERRAISQDYAATRQHVAGFGNVDGSAAMYVVDAPTIDDRVASARVNSQRLRDRAATVLSGEQLTVFNQMQDELMSDLQRHLRRMEPDKRGGS